MLLIQRQTIRAPTRRCIPTIYYNLKPTRGHNPPVVAHTLQPPHAQAVYTNICLDVTYGTKKKGEVCEEVP